jgi:hypothetical protein
MMLTDTSSEAGDGKSPPFPRRVTASPCAAWDAARMGMASRRKPLRLYRRQLLLSHFTKSMTAQKASKLFSDRWR